MDEPGLSRSEAVPSSAKGPRPLSAAEYREPWAAVSRADHHDSRPFCCPPSHPVSGALPVPTRPVDMPQMLEGHPTT